MTIEAIENLIFQLHFLRPLWFFGLLPALLLALIFRLRQGKDSAWEQSIDPDLLPHLIETQHSKPGRNPIFLIAFGWLLAIIALAGPVWEKTPQPVHEREDALIILFDLSRSMYATDVKPDRLTAARRKLLDLLKQRNEGVTGLVVYSGDAHLVSPLTDDSNTIAEMIPAVAPEFMPAPGSQLAPALTLAHSLFNDAGVSSGRIIIVTDEIRDIAESQNIARQHRYAFPISVLGVGTADGAPIPGTKLTRDGGYLKDITGTIIVPKVNFDALTDFANLAGGRFARMSLVDSDLDYLLAEEPLLDQEQFREMERDFDIWLEKGPWLLLLLLPLAALSFRRGWLWSALLLACFLPTDQVYASVWDDLWQTRDQQAIEAMNEGNPQQAASLFENQQWKASAQYKGQNFAGAAEEFQTDATDQGRYNLGNALAKLGSYEEAIQAYNAALELNPDHEDAQFNKQLVEELLESQQQDQEKSSEDENQPSDESEESEDNENKERNEEDSQEQSKDQQQEEESAEEESSEEQEQADQDQQDQEEKDATDQQMSEDDQEPLNEEQQQALEQWLKQVPDDPGGLLRRKFKMQYDERIKQGEVRRDETSNW